MGYITKLFTNLALSLVFLFGSVNIDISPVPNKSNRVKAEIFASIEIGKKKNSEKKKKKREKKKKSRGQASPFRTPQNVSMQFDFHAYLKASLISEAFLVQIKQLDILMESLPFNLNMIIITN